VSEILLTEDGSHTIYLPELKETYHSIHGAIQESNHVYIQHGLDYFVELKRPSLVRIFEVGFGTGLNALLSAKYAMDHQIKISYTSIEAYPLERDQAMLLNYPSQLGGTNDQIVFDAIHKTPWDECVQISADFELNKIHATLQQYTSDSVYDICYFDAFAPSKQAEMWELPILEKIAALMCNNGCFVTYSAKGQLKRDLKALGFEVETLPGPPGKLQMVRAIKI
jgi:tRNA U34 5-methylaminomethyl-2-thiouridine-forming methyltransferase MnmC